MPPQTTRAQDAFSKPYTPGTWRCRLCIPNVEDKGGQAAFARHYAREHLAPAYAPIERDENGQPTNAAKEVMP